TSLATDVGQRLQPNRPDERQSFEYPLSIGGEDVEGRGWVYTLTSRSLLEDAFASIGLKRALEKGVTSDAMQHPYVVGRCAVASAEDIDRAVEAASVAASRWAAVPLDQRMRLGGEFRDKLRANQDRFLKILVDEGHPIRVARWELESVLQIYSDESF